MLNIMICYWCKKEIPSDSFRVIRKDEPPSDDDSIECPNCKTLNNVSLAKGRAVDKEDVYNHKHTNT